MASPGNIMATLKKRQKTTAKTMKHIYNARDRMKKVDQDPRTEVQHLMECLVGGKYLFSQRVLPGMVKLFNTFSTVLIVTHL
jgi:hypothetical protein